MSKIYEDECCGCATESYRCVGSACPCRNVPHYYCDKCEQEFDADELYDTENGELCAECILEQYKKVSEKE